MTFDLIQVGIVQGLILAIIAFGIMIPFRFLSFPDLTAEGAYPLGGAICACLITSEISPILALLIGAFCGGMMAVATSQVSLRMKVDSLLAGIILSTMSYSVNLRIMGKPNIALFNSIRGEFNIFSLIIIICLCVIPFFCFLYTDFGLRFRAIGLNAKFAVRNGININKYTSLGLFIAGSMFGLAGGLVVQIQSFMDIGMGIGIVIHGLVSLMIGETVVGKNTISKQLASPIVGALIYQQIQGLALSLGLAPSDLKFLTGSIVLIVLKLHQKRDL
jgi:putative ABC transport system permease protein